MIIFDNHLHLRRDGRYLEAVKDFKNAGGTHFVLCQYPQPDLVVKHKRYNEVYQMTLDMAAEIRASVDVGVFVTVGPYPVDYLRLREHFSADSVMQIMQKGMERAAKLCVEQHCIAIGEIGRPHFLVDTEVMQASNTLMQYGMEQAAEVDVPVVLHTERATPAQCKELVEMGRKVGLPAEKIVKHFAPALITTEENSGLVPSVLASTKNIKQALLKGSRFLMETDYIDDVTRPGAVLGPKTVPQVTKKLLESDEMSLEQAAKIHQSLPQQVYDITLEE